ncbi:MAG: nitroreductase [Chloroflexi bacterium]|nr:nitroreductase [Chloroflexota bacterium]
MDILEAIRERKSVRGFRPDPVPKEVIAAVLRAAGRSPSSRNTQPWEITVVAGEPLDNIRQENVESLYLEGRINPDISTERYTGRFRERQRELAKQLFGLLGIAREDMEGRYRWQERGLRFFDAPVALIMACDSSLDRLRSQFDLGCVTQTICLAALASGLGTCIEDAGVTYIDVIRKHTGIPESKRVVIGVALGYPDPDYPANRLATPREKLENMSTWLGF